MRGIIGHYNTNSKEQTLNYKQALLQIQQYLFSIEHGQLKQLCETLSLDYKTVIRMKNDSIKKLFPGIIRTLLEHIKESEVFHEKKDYFTFRIKD